MTPGLILFVDDSAELDDALSRTAPGEPVAVFSRSPFRPPERVCFFRVRERPDWPACRAAVAAKFPGIQWRWLDEPKPQPAARPTPPFHADRDPAVSPTAKAEGADLAVICCHWNFADYRTPVRNLLRFLREMDDAGIPVYGLEMHLPGMEPAMAANPRWTVVELMPGRQQLWQKEAALNRLARQVPAGIPCLAAVDPDVRFSDPAWARRTVEALERTPVVQPFSEAVWTDAAGRVDLRRTCCARDGLDDRWRTHPGFAWAMRRDFFEGGPGLYPWCISGAGDTATAGGLLGGDPPAAALAAFGPRNLRPGGAATAWREAAADYMAGRPLGWTEGRIWHEWHGDRADRLYTERHRYMRHVEVGRHVVLGEDGLLWWTPEATPAMRSGIAGYFGQRREDG